GILVISAHTVMTYDRLSAFSFNTKGVKEKAKKKKTPKGDFARCDERPRLCLWKPQTFEKV
ncbi:MAG: hypothetical protein J6M03_03475, partial [Clostridia bacterium]|nr:hypothetical protein [Clostridia bacterium]